MGGSGSSNRLVADTDTTVTMTTASRLNLEASSDVLEKRKKALQTMATEKQIVKEAKGEFGQPLTVVEITGGQGQKSEGVGGAVSFPEGGGFYLFTSMPIDFQLSAE